MTYSGLYVPIDMDLLVIGADGADARLLSYYLEKGKMPNLRSLLDEKNATMKPMASRFSGNDVPHTGPAWTTIYTGLKASQHGVTEEGWIDGKISLSPHFDQTVFAELMDRGITVGAMTMAITYPAQTTDENSWMVSGYPSSEYKEQLIAPSAKEEALPTDFDEIQAKNLIGEDGPKASEQWRKAEQRKVNEILPDLVTGKEDVLFYGTQITDTMGHRARYRPFRLNGGVRVLCSKLNDFLGTSIQPPRVGTIAWTQEMRIAYETLDYIIGQLTEEFNPDDILIVSDHGFQLIGEDHSFVGVSIASDGIDRPESILEVKESILNRFGIKSRAEFVEIERPDQELNEEENSEVMDQLSALGYR